MEEWLYVMMIKKTKEYRKLNQAGWLHMLRTSVN